MDVVAMSVWTSAARVVVPTLIVFHLIFGTYVYYMALGNSSRMYVIMNTGGSTQNGILRGVQASFCLISAPFFLSSINRPKDTPSSLQDDPHRPSASDP